MIFRGSSIRPIARSGQTEKIAAYPTIQNCASRFSEVKTMPTLKEDVAKLANGAQLTYLDSGAPEGVSNYRTFIFIHGAAHNKCKFLVDVADLPGVWDLCLKITPTNVRALAFSQRGYKGSTPLTAEEASCTVPPSELHKTHVADLAAFIQFVAEVLRVPGRSSNGTGGITLVHWSKGCAAATGLFYFQNEHPVYKEIVDKYISSVVLYEAPTSAVFGLD